MSKIINTRISQKHDFEYNWINSASEFIPRVGELIVYEVEVDKEGNLLTQLPEGRTEPYTYSRMKIGDGITSVENLPFIDDALLERVGVLEAIDHDAYIASDVVVLSESQKYTDSAITTVEGKVTELSGNVYSKEETFTKDEVNAAIEAALTVANSWGEF